MSNTKAGDVGHSNLARSSDPGALNQALPLVVQVLSNPAVLQSLKEEGKRVDWEEIARLFIPGATKPIIVKTDGKVFGVPFRLTVAAPQV